MSQEHVQLPGESPVTVVVDSCIAIAAGDVASCDIGCSAVPTCFGAAASSSRGSFAGTEASGAVVAIGRTAVWIATERCDFDQLARLAPRRACSVWLAELRWVSVGLGTVVEVPEMSRRKKEN